MRAVLLLAAALFAAATHAAAPQKVLRVAFLIAETNFDPAAVSDLYSNNIIEEIFDAPLTYDFLARPAKLKPQTLVALPEITDNGRTYTLRLKKGIYFAADPTRDLRRPVLGVVYGAERWRFLGPAALVAAVITLLVAPPLLFADLRALSGSAGAAIGLVLSTSAVFSALVLRTDEHPLLRVMLVRYRLLLVGSTLAALFAAAALGFRARPWILGTTWALAAVVSALAAGILIIETVRAPSLRRGPPPPP